MLQLIKNTGDSGVAAYMEYDILFVTSNNSLSRLKLLLEKHHL
jgi:hypothetical protein